MQIIRASEMDYQPASHEDPANPEVVKKILVKREQLRPGQLQMINWAKMLPGRSFSNHYHEDMTEIFIIISGSAQITVSEEEGFLSEGDAVIIPAMAPHFMKNTGTQDLHYIALGTTTDQGGKTVVL